MNTFKFYVEALQAHHVANHTYLSNHFWREYNAICAAFRYSKNGVPPSV